MTTTVQPDAGERLTRKLHAVLLILLAASLGVWLWRTYGFEPLRIVDGPVGTAR